MNVLVNTRTVHKYPTATDYKINQQGGLVLFAGLEFVAAYAPGQWISVNKA